MAAPEQTQKTKSDELLEGQRKIERLLARARSLVATCGEPGDAHIAVARGLLDARSRDDEVTVAVVGLMKCGKSSLLSALCGTNLMPMDIPASTACVVRIVHEASAVVPSMVETTADGAILLAITGEAAIHNRLKELNAAGRANEHAGGTTEEIRVRLPALEHWRSDAPYRLVLLDTPGPNEREQGIWGSSSGPIPRPRWQP
ncbi:hypothetical protein CHLRE_13g569100v5 [Chlamydomonas reinhardtii]|uniref:Dynamin N-terminal domain-containing protein n=1 Tax=Chlamydomonas reinhardtii TaxID=3055 RepID=A0A2K3CZM0_CHLRE|nr:uncharacterized protein CHLRE_13g569100v5 [Chlamydomonas reinhardtii]PNW73701.1 hypothetical protein CHLRE_13g569100v5 [Chlamydomonas reinhardtii]